MNAVEYMTELVNRLTDIRNTLGVLEEEQKYREQRLMDIKQEEKKLRKEISLIDHKREKLRVVSNAFQTTANDQSIKEVEIDDKIVIKDQGTDVEIERYIKRG